MEGKEFDFLNHLINTKKITDDLLEEQILENEESFEYISTRNKNDENEKNKNGIYINIKENNNNEKNNNEEKKQKEEKIQKNEMNGFNNETINHQKISKKNVNLNKKNSIKKNNNINSDKDFKKKNIGQIKSSDNFNEKKRISNKKKTNKKAIRTNSIDNINLDKKKINHNYRSIDYKRNKNNFEDFNYSINNKVSIYQELFDNKMKNFINLKLNRKKAKIKFNSNDNLNKPNKRVIHSPSVKEMFSDDEIIQNHKIKNNYYTKINYNSNKTYKNKNKNNYKNMNIKYVNSNDNLYSNKTKMTKDYLEDDAISFKSKSKANRQGSLNTSMSNNSSEKFFQTYERFKESQQKQKEKLEYMKKALEDKEKKICVFKPKINKKSELIKDEYYLKQQRKLEQLRKKNEELKLIIKKGEAKELYLNSISKKCKNNERINKLYEWENNRKYKIKEKQITAKELQQKEVLKKPTINKNSRKLVMLNYHKYIKGSKNNKKNAELKESKDNMSSIFERLYIDDIQKREERRKILSQIYTPTFTPKLYKHKKRNQSDDDFFHRIKREKEFAYETEDNTDINNYRCLNNNNSLAQRIRNKLFKHKNAIRCNSCDNNLMKIKENKNEEKSFDDNDKYNDYSNENEEEEDEDNEINNNTETLNKKYKNYDINLRLSKNKNNNNEKNNTKNNLVNLKKQKRNINHNKSTDY